MNGGLSQEIQLKHSLKYCISECNLSKMCFKQSLDILHQNEKKLNFIKWVKNSRALPQSPSWRPNKTNTIYIWIESLFKHCITKCANLFYTHRYVTVFSSYGYFHIWQFYIEYSVVWPTCSLQFSTKTNVYHRPFWPSVPIGKFR